MSESQYVGTLLLGGNISQFSNQGALAGVPFPAGLEATEQWHLHIQNLFCVSHAAQMPTLSSCWQSTTERGGRP